MDLFWILVFAAIAAAFILVWVFSRIKDFWERNFGPENPEGWG